MVGMTRSRAAQVQENLENEIEFDNIEFMRRTICNQDARRLEDGQFLNDSCIDFFMTLVLHLFKESHDDRPVCFDFKTQFYNPKLCELCDTDLPVPDMRPLLRWMKGLDIWKADLLIVPVHEPKSSHWWLALVTRPWAALESRSGEDRRACLLCLDSLAGAKKRCKSVKDNLVVYLKADAAKHGEVFDESKLDEEITDAPLQKNGYDCGLFVVEYVLQILINKAKCWPILTDLQSTKRMREWFDQSVVAHRRGELKKCLHYLVDIVNEKNTQVEAILENDHYREHVKSFFLSKPEITKKKLGQEKTIMATAMKQDCKNVLKVGNHSFSDKGPLIFVIADENCGGDLNFEHYPKTPLLVRPSTTKIRPLAVR